MTLQQLSYFLAAAGHGSFSAAAEALHMAQPSLSEQVRRLEQELGVPLFTRLGRGLALTEAGETLVPHAERTLASAAEAADSVRGVRELTSGTANFGTFGYAWYYFLADLVEDFRKEFPGVRIRVVGINSLEVSEAVRDGRLEAGLVVLPIQDEGLDVRPAVAEELLYVSADPTRTAKPVTIERFAEAPLILYDATFGWEDPTRRRLAERAQRAGVRIEPEIELEGAEAAFELAERGVGDTIVARFAAQDPRFPGLSTVPFDPPLFHTFAFIQRRGADLSPATRELLRRAEAGLADVARERLGSDAVPGPA